VNLFMTELAVSNAAASMAWYRDRLGLEVELFDEVNGFVLLKSKGGRLALKQGTPGTTGVLLHFEVSDLEGELARLIAEGVTVVSPIQASLEGYRRAIVSDPDGYRVGVFQMR